jgi:DNA-binding transcriptional MerR regulator
MSSTSKLSVPTKNTQKSPKPAVTRSNSLNSNELRRSSRLQETRASRRNLPNFSQLDEEKNEEGEIKVQRLREKLKAMITKARRSKSVKEDDKWGLIDDAKLLYTKICAGRKGADVSLFVDRSNKIWINRWNISLQPKNHLDSWSLTQDNSLASLKKDGHKLKKIQEYMDHRPQTQIEHRWKYHLKPDHLPCPLNELSAHLQEDLMDVPFLKSISSEKPAPADPAIAQVLDKIEQVAGGRKRKAKPAGKAKKVRVVERVDLEEVLRSNKEVIKSNEKTQGLCLKLIDLLERFREKN